MTDSEFERLSIGDVLVNKASQEQYQVVAVGDKEVTVLRLLTTNDPSAWDRHSLVIRRGYVIPTV